MNWRELAYSGVKWRIANKREENGVATWRTLWSKTSAKWRKVAYDLGKVAYEWRKVAYALFIGIVSFMNKVA